MYTELIVFLIILIAVIYLIFVIRKKENKTVNVKKKVRFFGIPTQVDSIKPIFKPRTLHTKNKKSMFRFNPFNNIETYENCAIQQEDSDETE
jgi:hypothetical protein